MILDFSNIPGAEVWQIGNEGGFLPAPVNMTADNANKILMGPAERTDVIVNFTNVPAGSYVLGNVGPDEPCGGGVPGVDFPKADPTTTGQIMQFRVVPLTAADASTPPAQLGSLWPAGQQRVKLVNANGPVPRFFSSAFFSSDSVPGAKSPRPPSITMPP